MKQVCRLLTSGLALFLLAQAQPSPAPAVKTSVAVYQIKPAGVDASIASAMTSLLITRLTPSPQLRVIEEAMLKVVMERQGLNASDACDDTSCQVEIGKLVKAQKLVIGDLTKFGSKYILALKLVDIQTGVTDFTTEDSCACTEDQLPDLVTAVAARLRNHFGEQEPIPALPQSVGQASLPAQPSAAPPTSFTINLNDPEVQQFLAPWAETEGITKEQYLYKYYQDSNLDPQKKLDFEKGIMAWKNRPPIYKAVHNNDLAQVQQLLAQDPSLIQYQDELGNLLFQAHSPEMASFLIGKGLSINSKNIANVTPILWAILNTNKKMIEFYISQGANVNENVSGMTLLDLALLKVEHSPSAAKAQEAQEIADLLRQHGAQSAKDLPRQRRH